MNFHYYELKALLLLAELLILCDVSKFRKGCKIDIKEDIQLNTPLLLKSGKAEIIYESDDTINLSSRQKIDFACPGGEIEINWRRTAKAICLSGKKFKIDGNIFDFSEIICSRRLTSTAKYSGKKCGKNNAEIIIGFQITKKKFITIITVCFDKLSKNPLYSAFKLTKHIDSAQRGISRPRFRDGKFYNININSLYTRNVQIRTVNTQLGLSPRSRKYIKNVGSSYLARGHLAAKSDFVYGSQQMATFYYVNAVPQWQSFNNGNWRRIEASIKNYAIEKNADLEIYTGTYGILKLPHERTGEKIKLYMYSKNKNKSVPIPEIIWKVVYNPRSKAGVAILGINNPFISNIKHICSDISSRINWIRKKGLKIIKKGYTYFCSVNNLQKIVNYIPKLKVKSLLN